MSSNLDEGIACRIQHHPSRAHLIPELAARLDGLQPEVVTDPGGRPRSPWRTHRLCLETLPDGVSHLLVVQDDAWPCDNFAALTRAAVEERPDRIICLFVPGVGNLVRFVAGARKKNARWLEFPQLTFVPCVAIVYPTEHAAAIPAWADLKRIPVGRADDGVISQYARANRVPVCATMPSLVEHRDEVESIMGMPYGRGHTHRLAAWYEQNPCAVV